VPSKAPAAQLRYSGPMDVFRHVLREGGVAGLYKGMVPTMLREVPGNGVMFLSYEWLKRMMARQQVS
jgi:solute carrier family 25 (mitochondrial carnitine/acylcarnitine transporter), member 20/29